MYKLEKNNTSPLCILRTLMPQIIPLLTVMLVRTWYEESTLGFVPPSPGPHHRGSVHLTHVINTFHNAHALTSLRRVLKPWKRKGNGCTANTFIKNVFEFLCKVNFGSDKFIHDPMYTYHKAMQLAEFAKVMKHS